MQGNQNVQIAHVVGSTIQITFAGQQRKVPLQPAVVPVGKNVSSPARLLRARSGVIPYVDRAGLLADLEGWVTAATPLAGRVLGGRGGSGKTRLGVELCGRAEAAGWLGGLLAPSADQAALETLIDVPTARLIVIDYAESRVEQLDAILPQLAIGASGQHPVRVLLLVRAGSGRGGDWGGVLRHHSDGLDAVVDEMDAPVVLGDLPLDGEQRRALFAVAAAALASRAANADSAPEPSDELGQTVFASPLMVVIAAYLAVHRDTRSVRGGEELDERGDAGSQTTAGELFDELLAHERRYWKASADAHKLDTDEVLRQRVVALATLAGAVDEAHAVELLRLVPDLATASSERLGRLARWAHALYSGSGWWNPLEPDRIGEHLVARTFADDAATEHPAIHAGDEPALLAGVLQSDRPERLVQPLDLYARAAAEHPKLARTLTPILAAELQRLCAIAAEQAASTTDLELLLGDTTVAATLARVLTVIEVDASALPAAVNALPQRPDLILGPLALALTSQAVTVYRRLAAANAAAYEPALAMSLNNLSVRLAEAGRREEGLAAIQEAVTVRRRLAAASAAAYEPALASSLNNLSNRLAEAGRREDAERARQEAHSLSADTTQPVASSRPG